jgi:hypothetical protein
VVPDRYWPGIQTQAKLRRLRKAIWLFVVLMLASPMASTSRRMRSKSCFGSVLSEKNSSGVTPCSLLAELGPARRAHLSTRKRERDDDAQRSATLGPDGYKASPVYSERREPARTRRPRGPGLDGQDCMWLRTRTTRTSEKSSYA